jgi:predicted Rossmann fold flavoprotein
MEFNTVIIGGGAAGLMCAAHAGPGALVVDHAKAPGEKIRISGGGRCNFTNMYTEPSCFLSQNPHFCKSALARYTQWDFIDLVASYDIAYHEKTLGQLFCDVSAKQIVSMLLAEMDKVGAQLMLKSSVSGIEKTADGFEMTLMRDGKETPLKARNLVLATGGKSIPKMGATGFAYDVARQFGLAVTDTRPALVPLTFTDARFAGLSGVSAPAVVTAGDMGFSEAVLFTHRGLSGPAILQASSYWSEGEDIAINLAPEDQLFDALRDRRQQSGRRNLTTELAQHIPARLVEHLGLEMELTGNLADWSDTRMRALCDALGAWTLTPSGSEGYRTAEVTLGGIDTDTLSSKTMEAKAVPSLYVIGEAVDVTGWLGGYNFQWAWSSAVAAGRAIASGGSILKG